MAESIVEALLDEIPPEEIRGIYLMGSGQKEWDSPIDYVPEISDVDIHIQFYSNTVWRQYIGTVPLAIEIQHKVEMLFLSKISKPLHTPRPQLLVINKMMHEFGFVYSPRHAVRVLYGEEYPIADYSDPNYSRPGDCDKLMNDEAYLTDFSLHLIDRPGKYVWESLRPLVWRVAPVGPRVLHISGADTEIAWSVNRTHIVSMLQELGQPELARHYLEFYLAGWEYFLSRYESSDAGRSVISAGVEVLTRAAKIARNWLASHQRTDTPAFN